MTGAVSGDAGVAVRSAGAETWRSAWRVVASSEEGGEGLVHDRVSVHWVEQEAVQCVRGSASEVTCVVVAVVVGIYLVFSSSLRPAAPPPPPPSEPCTAEVLLPAEVMDAFRAVLPLRCTDVAIVSTAWDGERVADKHRLHYYNTIMLH